MIFTGLSFVGLFMTYRRIIQYEVRSFQMLTSTWVVLFHIKHRPQHLGYIKEAEYILSSEGQSLSFPKQDYCGIWQNRTHMLNDTRRTELHYSSLFKFTTTVYEKLPEIIWVASCYLLLRLLSKTQETQYNNTRSTLIQWTRSTPITQGLGSSLTELWEQIFLA